MIIVGHIIAFTKSYP